MKPPGQFNEIVFNRIQYMPNSTSVDTAADAVFTTGAGVCQDYAHVLIALLKRAGIPARYACGLSVGEGVTHAWVQAYLGGSWIGLDSHAQYPDYGRLCNLCRGTGCRGLSD